MHTDHIDATDERRDIAAEIAFARALVLDAFTGVVDRHGIPVTEHMRRVAERAPAEAQAAAWLHDIIEDTAHDEARLLSLGVHPEVVATVSLLSRPEADEHGHRLTYQQWIESLAVAGDVPGRLARHVKLIDLDDNLSRPTPPDMEGIERRYLRARRTLRAACAAQGEPLPGARPVAPT